MEFPDYHSRATKACVFICGIFMILFNGTSGQDVTCDSLESDRTNVFDTYDVTVSGATDYTLTYEPAEYGPGMMLPLGTTEVTVMAVMSSSPTTQIGSCIFNITVNLQELPVVCPRFLDLTVGTEPGQPFYTYPDPPFNITYPPQSMTYMPYGNITMVRQYGSTSSDIPRLDISWLPHLVSIVISDGTLEKSCNEALITVEDHEPPTIVCPDDIYQNQTKVSFNFSPRNVTDNSGALVSTTVQPFVFPGGDFPVGTTTYTFTVFDSADNNASCSVNVIVSVVTCDSLESDRTNVFDTYDVTVSGATDYTLTYEPAEYGPGMSLPLGTTEVTVMAAMSSSPSTQIESCTFNVTINLQELPIICPPAMDLTVGTDPGQPFYTYPDPPFNITYPPESMTYIPYGSIAVVRQYGAGSSSNDPRLDVSSMTHFVTIVISDGTLEKSCNEAAITVEDREPPTFVCPNDIYQNQTKVDFNSFNLRNVTDNSGSLVSTIVQPFVFPGGDFPVGTTTYTFTVADVAGNTASCSINVTVELETDECLSIPCQNNGICIDLFNDYNCTCVPGYEGKNCENETDECLSIPCQNKGICMDLFNDYNCTCVPGYEGKNCENGSSMKVTTKEASTNGVSTEASVPSSNSSKFPGMRISDSFTLPSSPTLTNGPQTSSTDATIPSAISRQSTGMQTGLIAALGALSASLVYAVAIISVYIHYRRRTCTATKLGTPDLYMDVKSRAKPDQS